MRQFVAGCMAREMKKPVCPICWKPAQVAALEARAGIRIWEERLCN